MKPRRYDRALIVDDLIDHYPLMGADATQVKQLLGEATLSEHGTWIYPYSGGARPVDCVRHSALQILFRNDKVYAIQLYHPKQYNRFWYRPRINERLLSV